MEPNPTSPLADAFASLRRALAAQAQADALRPGAVVGSISLALILSLLDALVALAAIHAPAMRAGAPIRRRFVRRWSLRRTIALRRARLAARGSRGRLRFPTWWDRNRGARSIPRAHPISPRPTHARAPPQRSR